MKNKRPANASKNQRIVDSLLSLASSTGTTDELKRWEDVVSLCEYVSQKLHYELTLEQGKILFDKLHPKTRKTQSRKGILEAS
jgi:hypothetical protein